MDNECSSGWVFCNGRLYNPQEWDIMQWQVPKDVHFLIYDPVSLLCFAGKKIELKLAQGEDCRELLLRYLAFADRLAHYLYSKCYAKASAELQRPAKMKIIDDVVVVVARRSVWNVYDGLRGHPMLKQHGSYKFIGVDIPKKFTDIEEKISSWLLTIDPQ